MNKYINRNFFWADLFVNQLKINGVKHVCISPGSRNTPLTLAFARNKSLKKYVFVDERSSGFFALGLSKFTRKPVAIVTTSGTAVAELYPAIIEAYYQRISLIVCTADRPLFLRDSGANQTINQTNIFGNHIRHFKDFGLPSLNENRLRKFSTNISEGIRIGQFADRGPIHFNFPFKKPLEPRTFTDDISLSIDEFLIKPNIGDTQPKVRGISQLLKEYRSSKRPMLHCGWDNIDNKFYRKLKNFAELTKIPILADGASGIRYLKGGNKVIVNHSAFLPNYSTDADFIISFGNAPTSSAMLKYFEKTKAKRFLVNEFGDLKDPSKKKGRLLKINPASLIDYLSEIQPSADWKNWSSEMNRTDKMTESIKSLVARSKFGSEPRIINELLSLIPDNSNLFISNSLPIRDFDYFASRGFTNLNVFVNRGASGIDGIISTSAGISAESKTATYLVIGDLAFYHNLSALSTLGEYQIPLIMILINNGGGNIFRMLPVSKNKKYFEDYFITPQSMNHRKISAAFNGKYQLVTSWRGLKTALNKASASESFSLIEIRTDPRYSVELRQKYWTEVSRKLNCR